MADQIPVPSYPAGSHHFVKRLLPNDAEPSNATHANGVGGNTKHLDIAVVGAGVGGLATAVALRGAGFNVTVYESSPVLSEIGAGIQVPPNSARILHSWGLEHDLKQKSVKPQSLIWRRWENGKTIGLTHLNPQFQEWFGAPYYLIHRAHLHEVLHKRAEELGVPIKLNSSVAKYKVDEPSFVLRDGSVVRADLIVAADGLRSFARRTLLGDQYTAPNSNGTAAYRATLTIDDIRSNPKTAWIADSASLNLWVGHQTHAMTYFIAGSKIFNMVLTHPEPNGDPTSWDQSNALTDMRAVYTGWDPSLVELVNMVSSTQKWPIQSIEIPDSWSSSSGKLILLGDAAHAMLPNMALGAAMAVEDAAALAECLVAYPGKEALRSAIDMYERLRIPRARKAQESSVLHGYTLHYPDGPLQQARDIAMRSDIDGEHYIDSPNQFSDPATQLYFYMYDVMAETRKEIERERTSKLRS